MTISTTTNKALGLGNGATVNWPYNFLIQSVDQLVVTYIDANGFATTLGAGAYAVSGLGNPAGGTVTYPTAGAPIAAGTQLLIERILAFQQNTSLTNQGGYYPRTVEAMADALEMQIQQLATGSRASPLALTFPYTDLNPVTVLPVAAARANKFLAFDAQGNPQMLGGTGGGGGGGDISTSTFKSTGSTTARSMATRGAEVINVLDYAAVGDGVTDDTAACQAAANVASGKILYFPGGKTYLFSTLAILANTTVEAYGAIFKQKVLGNNVGSPMLNLTGGFISVLGAQFNGQRFLQPANGFSDSFNTGANGTGRAFRAAILCDSLGHGYTQINVRDCFFTACYGACVATRDVSQIFITDNTAYSTAFEIAYLFCSGAAVFDAVIARNYCNQVGSGDATVNADNIYAKQYQNILVQGNLVVTAERCHTKIEGCLMGSVVGNVINTNTIGNFAAFQFDGLSPCRYLTIEGNTAYACGEGILLSQGTYEAVSIIGNTIDQTHGPTLGDAISITANVAGSAIIVANNVGYAIQRHGIIVSGIVSALSINGNNLSGDSVAGSYGLILNATGAWLDCDVRGNRFRLFEQSAAGSGTVNFARSAAFTITNFIFQGNTVLAGGAANRGVRTPGLDMFVNGIVADNYIDGQLELYSASLRYRNNTVTGVISLPVGSGNTEVPGGDQATVGAAGAAAALPATPSKYLKITDNGTSYVIPAYLPA